jgi:DNA-binding MarR family transcriptional regulator
MQAADPSSKSMVASRAIVDLLGIDADVGMVELGSMVTRLSRLYTMGLDAAMAERGITTSEAAVLTVLVGVGPPHQESPTRLYRAVAQSPAGITKTLARLESAGLVRRVPDQHDRRSLLVELTPDGLHRAAEVVQDATRFQAGLLADLDQRARDALARSIRSILRALESQLGVASSG